MIWIFQRQIFEFQFTNLGKQQRNQRIPTGKMNKEKRRVLKINSKDYEQVIEGEFKSWVLSVFKYLRLDIDLYSAMLMDEQNPSSRTGDFISSEKMWKDHLVESGIEILNVNLERVEIVKIGKYLGTKWIEPVVVCAWNFPKQVRATTPPGIQIYLLEYTEPF